MLIQIPLHDDSDAGSKRTYLELGRLGHDDLIRLVITGEKARKVDVKIADLLAAVNAIASTEE